MNGRTLIIGGGITGIQVANVLGDLGFASLLIEKTGELGGRVSRLSRTFPFFDDDGFYDGAEFVAVMSQDLAQNSMAEVRLGRTLCHLEGDFPDFRATLSDGSVEKVNAVVVAAGYEPFDPTGLGEYGYGVYPDVVTASELEWMLNPRGPTGGRLLRPSNGQPVRRLAIIFCVGSRNRRINAPFCSRICCSYSTKQAITVLERHPETAVTCFYMDVRTYDRGFEEMYSKAQERGIRYIRGRVSSCRQQSEGDLILRAENTLLGRPIVGEFDLVSLSTGMRPFKDVDSLAKILKIDRAPDGFLMARSWFRHPHDATRPGVFIAGCVTGIKPIRNCLVDASSAASRVAAALRGQATPAAPPVLPSA